jgi:hypothetical protein
MKQQGWRARLLVAAVEVAGLAPILLLAQVTRAQGDPMQSLNLVVFMRAEAAINRTGWTSYVPVAFGTYLRQPELKSKSRP